LTVAALTTLDAAREYVLRGFAVVPIPHGEKAPCIDGWQNLRLTENDLPEHFSNGANIGILTGEASGNLIDVDLDAPEAIAVADCFLPPTDLVHGRLSKPRSHRWYRVSHPLSYLKFSDPRRKEDATLVELRQDRHQTLVPPSEANREIRTWDKNGDPASVDGAALSRIVPRVAASALLARYWPPSGRHDARMALGGALAWGGWAEEEAITFVRAVVQVAQPGDREAYAKVNGDTRAAFAKLQRQEHVTGLPRLAELLGNDIVDVAAKWLGLDPQNGPRSATAEWPEPKPIQAALRPVAPFDPDTLLPDVLRAWVMDEADRMPCAPDFIAVGAMVALGAIIGARCAIKPKAKDDWLVVPNLWGGIVGLPSAKKSPAIGAALKPMDRLIAQAMEAHNADMEGFEASKTVFEARKEAIEDRISKAAKAKNDKAENLESIVRELTEHQRGAPCAPILRRFKTNDSTIEKLGELLRENIFGLLVLRDELVGLLVSWEREGREGDRAFFLEGWNGNASFDTDRIGRGSIFIPNLCLSIFGGIQPDKLTGYLEQAANALANDGMLQRFQLLVYPDHCAWEWRDRRPNKQARNRVFTVFEALAGFDAAAWGASPADDFAKFPYFSFGPKAQENFIEWSVDLHQVRLPAEDHPIIAQHLTKFDKLFPALALILHLVDCAATGERGPVSAESALRAAAWCDYLENHARRCYGLLMDDGFRAALALAEKVRQSKLPDGFTARDVRRNQWRSLTTDEAVQAALDWLEDEGWLRAVGVGGTGPGTGRRTNRYSINPKIQKTAKRGTANTDDRKSNGSNGSPPSGHCPES
jgi:hypothetical protein